MPFALRNNISIKKLLVTIGVVVSIILLIGNGMIWLSNQALSRAEEDMQRLNSAMLSFKNVRYHAVQIQQFLTDASAVGSEDFSEAQAQRQEAHTELDQLKQLVPELGGVISGATRDVDQLYQTGEQMALQYVRVGREAGNAIMKAPNDGFDARSEALADKMEQLASQLESKIKVANTDQRALLRTVFWVNSGGAMCVLVLFILTGLFLYRRLITILGGEPAYAADVANQVAEGNLKMDIVYREGNEQSLLAQMRAMVDALSSHMRSIDIESKQIAQSSYQISEISERISNASHEQEACSVDVRQATSELSETSATVLSLSEAVSQSANQTRLSAQEGIQAVRSNMTEMSQAVSEARTAEAKIRELGEASTQIQNITQTIASITEQTNLLALNAAIEAARAGEAGRGFAVVADEVRSLALRASVATDDITRIIGNLTTLVADNTAVMGSIIQRTNTGMEKAQGTNAAFSQIMQEIDHNYTQATQISQVSQDQMRKLGALQESLGGLLDTLTRNAAEVHTTGVISGDLYLVTERLRSMVQHFVFDSQVLHKPAPNEHRKAPRVAKNLMVKVADQRGEHFAVTADFSMTGMRLRLPVSLDAKEDSRVQLHILIPHDGKEEYLQQQPLAIPARVQWVSSGDEGHLYGVEFEQVDSSKKERLDRCFAYYNQVSSYAA